MMATYDSSNSKGDWMGFTDVKSNKGSGGGEYSFEVSLALLFWNEMRRYDNADNPPVFDGGLIMETPNKQKCKVKLVGLGKEVLADCGYGSNLKKGMYALVLCKSNDKYVIISAKNFGGNTSTSSEYPV